MFTGTIFHVVSLVMLWNKVNLQRFHTLLAPVYQEILISSDFLKDEMKLGTYLNREI